VAAPTAAAAPKYGGTYRTPVTGEAPHMDTHQTNNNIINVGGISLAYSRLVKLYSGPNRRGEDAEVRGDLAESWTQADDVTYTFKLRPNVKWQNIAPVNGRPLVAEDVKYSFERILGLKVNASFLGGVEKVEAVDPQTVKLTVAPPDSDFLASLASVTNTVVPHETVELKGDLKEGPVIGTGAWILQEWKPNQIAVVKKNPDYFLKGLPYLDEIQFVRFADADTAQSAFRSRQLHTAPTGYAFRDIQNLKQVIPGLQVSTDKNQAYWLELGMNSESPPLNDVRVRRAFQIGFDRQVIMDTIFDGLGYYSVPFMLPGFDWIVPEDELRNKWYKRDVAGAKRLLAEAGHPNGIDVEMTHLKFALQWQTAAELTIAQLQEAGIRATLKLLDQPTFSASVRRNGEFQTFHAANEASSSTNAYLFSSYHSKGGAEPRQGQGPEVG
jgi:peptide/nickel transport system substrate-binding protein